MSSTPAIRKAKTRKKNAIFSICPSRNPNDNIVTTGTRIMVISAIALLLYLFSSSAPASMVFTLFIWILGHFSEELRFVGEKATNILAKIIIWVVYHLTPDLSYYNYRDYWIASQIPEAGFFMWIFIYSIAYIGICLSISNFLFSQKSSKYEK